ncbi:phosphatase PAP2 family protein [Pediococcus stilesii]|uniref:Phosphatase PAP2 family protein n=2 Tax=Pediococcus stilesii TaxID=331679 RepID=A0A5R9BRL7_9LACO|nr:phosphatase PAP2 family protein [Pediococcus stilesii]
MLKLSLKLKEKFMNNRSITNFILNLLPVSLFIILTALVSFKSSWVQFYDMSISSYIQSFRTPTLNSIVKMYTKTGNSIPFIIISLIVVGIFYLFKKYRASLFLLTTIFLGTSANFLVKQLIRRDRPEFRLINIGGYSFPSGHSVAAMVLFGSLIVLTFRYIQKRSLRIFLTTLLTILMLLLALSRVYLNVHYPTDITAGLLLGLIVLQITSHVFFKEGVQQNVK